MEERNMGLDGNYPCTITKRAVQIGLDQTKNGEEGDSLICLCCWIIAFGELSIFLFNSKAANLYLFLVLAKIYTAENMKRPRMI